MRDFGRVVCSFPLRKRGIEGDLSYLCLRPKHTKLLIHILPRLDHLKTSGIEQLSE